MPPDIAPTIAYRPTPWLARRGHGAAGLGCLAFLAVLALFEWLVRVRLEAGSALALLLLAVAAGGCLLRAMEAQRRLSDDLQGALAQLHDLARAVDAHLAVDVADAKGRLLRVNERFSRLAQYGSEELAGRDLGQLEADQQPGALGAAVAALPPQSLWQGEVRCRARDGSRRWLETTLAPLRGGPGDAARWLALRTDLTAQRLVEEQCRQAQAHAAELSRQLVQVAAVDLLTGLADRHHLQCNLVSEMGRSQRSGLPLALLMIEVDDFQDYRDRYGPAQADACLRRLATAARNVQRRPGDLVARWDAQGFAMLLPDTDAAGGMAMAELLRVSVEALRLPHEGSPLGHVSVSIGAYAVCPTLDAAADELLQAASEALQHARQFRRNRTRLHRDTFAASVSALHS